MIEKTVPEIQLLKVCNDSRKAADLIHQFQPGLIFMDIQMPYLNGFQLLDKLPNKNFKIIFTTAFNEYAIQAIRFSALDYLLKPVDIEELQQSVQRFIRNREDYSNQFELLKNIMHNLRVPAADEFRLALPTKEGVHFLRPAEIVRCESVGNYTRFFNNTGKTFLISRTLGDYDEILTPHRFIRTHKSHLINIKFISYIGHDGYIVLTDNTRVEVSRRRKEEVMAALR
jgi:two-component system LytT family response regulator